ncbi:hypothetical protein ACIQRS_26305 [Streptomyces termitum]|uniref:Uncharacterized protein n=1 Tax=Streptomyces termitum TaxID=67368 RepID=A0A918T935_9ACTN|nr:hypothetical protein [Streptomyces termitum]GHB02140.1 hypothetical protein GCM10010305_51780 [Streptomyces termitum]
MSARRGRFVRAAPYGVLAGVVLSALPAQIRWADEIGRVGPVSEPLDKLRFLLVSPTLLYGGRTGAAAFLHEALWAVLFTGVLVLGARALAVRAARPSVRAVLFCWSLPFLAPVAHLLALYALELPALVTDAARRDASLTQLLWSAQASSAHAMVLGTLGAVAAFAVWKPDPSPDVPTDLRALPRALFLFMRGPMETLWRRIGVTCAASCAAVLLLFLVPSLGRGLLDGAAFPPAPGNAPYSLSGIFLFYARLYAAQGFLLAFALPFFVLRALDGVRTGPASALLIGWSAYVLGAFVYGGVAEAGVLAGQRLPVRPETLHELLLPPASLEHSLLGAPVAGIFLALCSWAAGRVSAARKRNIRPDGVRPDVSRETVTEDVTSS